MFVSKLGVFLTIVWLALLVSACGSAPTESISAPTPTPIEATTPLPTATVVEPATATPADLPGQGLMNQAAAISTTVVERTPAPTPTPNIVDRAAENIVRQTGLEDITFLGLTSEDWIDSVVSVLLFGLTLGIVIPLLMGLISRVVNRTKTAFDDEFFDSIKRVLALLLIVIASRNGLIRLNFLNVQIYNTVLDISFILILLLILTISVRFVSFSMNWFLNHRIPEGSRKRSRPVIAMIKWAGYLVLTVLASTFLLAHFGVNITLVSSSLLFISLIIAIIGITARSAIGDTVSGFMILIDQPFRGGDYIYIAEIETWGEVTSIGLRSTRIYAGDNREIIVPNSLIATSQVINYSQPDASYRVQVDFRAIGKAFHELQELIKETVREVDGVLPDKPIDVIYLSFGGTGRKVRVRWWVDDPSSQFVVQNEVFVALEQALLEAGIETPDLMYRLNMAQNNRWDADPERSLRSPVSDK